jgi:hypothetical protein
MSSGDQAHPVFDENNVVSRAAAVLRMAFLDCLVKLAVGFDKLGFINVCRKSKDKMLMWNIRYVASNLARRSRLAGEQFESHGTFVGVSPQLHVLVPLTGACFVPAIEDHHVFVLEVSQQCPRGFEVAAVKAVGLGSEVPSDQEQAWSIDAVLVE